MPRHRHQASKRLDAWVIRLICSLLLLLAACPQHLSAQPTTGTDRAVDTTVKSAESSDQNSTSIKKLVPVPKFASDPTNTATDSMDLESINTNELIGIGKLRLMKLEASYNEPINLEGALRYAITHNLPIGISRESFNISKYQFGAALSEFLPSYSMFYSPDHTHIKALGSVTTTLFQNQINWPVFQGGSVMFNSLVKYYQMHGARNAYHANINDTLLSVFQAYNNLLLQRVLLQIRTKAVEVSKVQLKLNEDLFRSGLGTRFAILQSQTQLSLDRQSLLTQEAALREATIELEFLLNVPLSTNLLPQEKSIHETMLIDQETSINDLISVAIEHRPELKQLEDLRLAANRGIQLAAAPLYPTVNLYMQQNRLQTSSLGSNNLVSVTLPAGTTVASNGSGSPSNSSSTLNSTTIAMQLGWSLNSPPLTLRRKRSCVNSSARNGWRHGKRKVRLSLPNNRITVPHGVWRLKRSCPLPPMNTQGSGYVASGVSPMDLGRSKMGD